MAAKTAQVIGAANTVQIGDQEFVVPYPTPADMVRVREKMREIASKSCVHPVAAVNAIADTLSGPVLTEALRQAVQISSGGGSEPTQGAIIRAYDSLEGVRFQLWYFARKTNTNLTSAEVEALVTDDNRYDVADALAKAVVPEVPNGPKASAGGES